jgi:HD-GYP domain-containing protein (c-di-GMP phosphodiesterase class II)
MRLVAFAPIRTRLMLLVALAVLPALAIIWFTALEQRRLDTEDAQTDAQRQAVLVASDFERAVVGIREVLLLLSQMPEVRSDVATCQPFLREQLASYPMYGNFNVILPDGTVRCDALGGAGTVTLGDREYFQRAMATRVFAAGDFTVGRTTGRPSIVFAQPVLDAAGQVEFVLSVGLDLDWMSRHLTEGEWPAGTILLQVDPAGTVIGSYPPGRIGQSIRGVPGVEQALVEQRGVARAPQGYGEPYLLGFETATVGNVATDVHVIVGIPEAVALRTANAQLTRNLALLGLVTLLALLAAWVAGDRLVARPVQRLVRSVRALQDGDLTARVGAPYSGGEIGDLGRIFDHMAGELQHAYLQTVEVLADAVETRDPYTGGHVGRVSDYALAVGRELGWSERDLVRLQMAAALHDVGKIGVPDAVLRKQGPLDDQELPVMRSHTHIGARLLDGVAFLAPALDCALSHQEFYNGKGYPRGLAGDAIGADARIVAIADTFDAMTTTRPYRKGLPVEVALAELQKCAGAQFDPTMVAAFLRAVEKGAIAPPPAPAAEPAAPPAPVA